MHLRAVVASIDGSRVIRAAAQGPADRPSTLVESVSRSLLDQGGRAILEEVSR
jgi:hydroxymethylbilane synthase